MICQCVNKLMYRTYYHHMHTQWKGIVYVVAQLVLHSKQLILISMICNGIRTEGNAITLLDITSSISGNFSWEPAL